LETSDLRVLRISENVCRLTKYVRYYVKRVQYLAVTNVNIIQYTTRSQCNCLSRGSDGEKQEALKYHEW